jgi:hypothetical protein
MSWGAQNRSKDAKTPSAGRAMSRNPKPELCGIQRYCLVRAHAIGFNQAACSCDELPQGSGQLAVESTHWLPEGTRSLKGGGRAEPSGTSKCTASGRFKPLKKTQAIKKNHQPVCLEFASAFCFWIGSPRLIVYVFFRCRPRTG